MRLAGGSRRRHRGNPAGDAGGAFAVAALGFGALALVGHLAGAPFPQWLDPRVLTTQLAGAGILALATGALAVASAALLARAGLRGAATDLALAITTALVVVGQCWFPLEPLLARLWPPLASGLGAVALGGAAAGAYAIARVLLAGQPSGAWRLLAPWIALLSGLSILTAALASGVANMPAFRHLGIVGAGAALFCVAVAAAGRLHGMARVAGCLGCVGVALAVLRLVMVNPHDRVTTAPAPASPARGPSVLLVVLDTFRADAFDPTGARTPQLARLAQRADVHTHAVANASWTLPGHASLFTGRFLAHHRTDLTPTPGFSSVLADSIPTAATLFSDAGWATACVTANAIVGLRNGIARGCQRYQNPGRAWLSRTYPQRLLDLVGTGAGRAQLQLELFGVNENATAAEIVDAGLREVDAGPQPLFLFLNFLDVHGPYTPPPPSEPPSAAARRAHLRDQALRLFGRIDDATLWRRHAETLRAYYAAQARALDAELGRLFDELDRRGWLDGAIVVVTSDHGEGFFENPDLPGYFGHHSAYEAAVRIPLLVKRPGQRAGTTSERLVQQADVLPTLLALAGLPPAPGVDGRPLDAAAASPVVTQWYTRSEPGSFPFQPARRDAIYDGSYKYLRDATGREFLYDLARAPWETVDVLAAQPETAARLRASLDAALPHQPDGGAQDAAPLDAHLRDQLRALGYVE
jgi:arylsulfatase A-like enzyme